MYQHSSIDDLIPLYRQLHVLPLLLLIVPLRLGDDGENHVYILSFPNGYFALHLDAVLPALSDTGQVSNMFSFS